MNSMILKFTELPLWLKHENATNLVPAARLKTLRENQQIRFRTIEGKLCYPLTDLLKAAGVDDLIVHSEFPIQIPKVGKPIATFEAEKATTAENEGSEELKRKFFFCDLFTYKSNVLPEDTKLPTLRIRQSADVFTYPQAIKGKIVDIQMYKAKTSSEAYPKVRFIIQSLTKDDEFLVLQTRYDKYHASYFADLIAETVAFSENLENGITITVGLKNDRSSYSVLHNENTYTFTNPESFQEPIEIKVIESKLKAAIDKLKDSGLQRHVLTE